MAIRLGNKEDALSTLTHSNFKELTAPFQTITNINDLKHLDLFISIESFGSKTYRISNLVGYFVMDKKITAWVFSTDSDSSSFDDLHISLNYIINHRFFQYLMNRDLLKLAMSPNDVITVQGVQIMMCHKDPNKKITFVPLYMMSGIVIPDSVTNNKSKFDRFISINLFDLILTTSCDLNQTHVLFDYVYEYNGFLMMQVFGFHFKVPYDTQSNARPLLKLLKILENFDSDLDFKWEKLMFPWSEYPNKSTNRQMFSWIINLKNVVSVEASDSSKITVNFPNSPKLFDCFLKTRATNCIKKMRDKMSCQKTHYQSYYSYPFVLPDPEITDSMLEHFEFAAIEKNKVVVSVDGKLFYTNNTKIVKNLFLKLDSMGKFCFHLSNVFLVNALCCLIQTDDAPKRITLKSLTNGHVLSISMSGFYEEQISNVLNFIERTTKPGCFSLDSNINFNFDTSFVSSNSSNSSNSNKLLYISPIHNCLYYIRFADKKIGHTIVFPFHVEELAKKLGLMAVCGHFISINDVTGGYYKPDSSAFYLTFSTLSNEVMFEIESNKCVQNEVPPFLLAKLKMMSTEK